MHLRMQMDLDMIVYCLIYRGPAATPIEERVESRAYCPRCKMPRWAQARHD